MENAVERIQKYIAGSRDARIESNEEGELYRLFHEVNSLAAVLSTHAESEEKAKEFLKNIISDISHQLKTPLAALNIYNGIIQEEAKDLPTIREFTDYSEQELDRIESLVQNLLNIAKFDAGTIMLEKTAENISDMIESVKKRFSFRAAREGKEIIPISARIRRKQSKMIILCIVLAVFLVTSIFSLAEAAIRTQAENSVDKAGYWHIRLNEVRENDAASIATRSDVTVSSWYDVVNFDENFNMDKEYYMQ